MTHLSNGSRRWAPAVLLAATALMAACGSSSSDSGDLTPPTVVITDSVPGATATGDVTFNFTFSEDVGTSFAAADVTVTGGAKGAFTRSSATFYTLVVTPTAATAGTITVTLPAGSFTDLAGIANTGAASTSQAYDTRPAALTQMSLPVSFDTATVDYGVVGFEGAEDSTIVADPTNAANKVAKVVKSATAQTFAGTTVTAVTGGVQTGFSSKIPFDAQNTRMTVRTWSPDAGIKVRLKVEDHTNAGISVETEATTTVASTWETLTFDFANQAAGTAAIDVAKNFDKATIFFNFGVTGATAGAKTYYFDDVIFIGGGGISGGGPTPFATVTFDDAAVTYTLTGFGGAEDSTKVADPTNAANQVAKVNRSATAETFAGTTISTGPNNTVGKIPFAVGSTKMTVRVWSPDAGIQVRLKVEDHTNAGVSVETEATTTVAATWETLTFDFTVPTVPPTAAINYAATYDRATIFFNFGVNGATAGAKTYYCDDLTFVPGTGGGGGGSSATQVVFADDYAAGVAFAAFGGSTNALSVDASQAHAGTSSLRVEVPAAGYTGGALNAAAPQDLSAYNAISFWAKASKAATLNVSGLGNNAGAGPSYSVESLQLPLTTAWQRFIVPIPVPARLTASQGLFHFAEGAEEGAYTVWFDDVQYVDLSTAEVGTPAAANVGWGSPNLAVGATFQINPAPNAITWGPPVLTNGGNLTNVGFRYYTLTSSNPAVATVDPDGVITGVSGGTTNISATLGGLAVPGVAIVTVTAPLAVPATIAAAPTAPAIDVISMFSSVYTNVGVDSWSTSWSGCCNTLTDPFDIAGHPVKKYELKHFVGIEFVGPNAIDASAMAFLHMDVWTPNGTEFQVRLVNAVGPGQTEATVTYNAGSTPAITTGSWISLDIPLSAFAGLAGRNALGQMLLLVPTGTTGVFYVDNVYFRK